MTIFSKREILHAGNPNLLFNRRRFRKVKPVLTGSDKAKRRHDAKVLAGFCSHDGSDPGWKFDAVCARGM